MGLDRVDFFKKLNDLDKKPEPKVPQDRPVDKLVAQAYVDQERKSWEAQTGNDPHGRQWSLCLGGETEVVTRNGLIPIRELADKESLILVLKDGHWVFEKTKVNSFGKAKLKKITLINQKKKKIVFATENHKWFSYDPKGMNRSKVIQTKDLIIGQKLLSAKASPPSRTSPTPFAFPQGFVYGDGTVPQGSRGCRLSLFHNGKDEAMIKYFSNNAYSKSYSKTGMKVYTYRGLPGLWKEGPNFKETRSFLLSWLAGYFAADGCVGSQGQAILSSASIESINIARSILSICGVGYGNIRETTTSGTYPHGVDYHDHKMYFLTIETKFLPDWFFLLEKHKSRIEEWKPRREKTFSERTWKVQSVEDTDRVEEVFCAEVPNSHAFVLSEGLVSGNSFHASQFPGKDDKYCPRKDVYSLMNIPAGEPFKRAGRAIMDAGLAIEDMITTRLAKEGYLISAAPWEPTQTGFVDEENWITGNCDGIIAFPGDDKVHVLEIKTKFDEVIRAMLGGAQGPDAQHVKQLKTYIGFVNKNFYTDPNLKRLTEAIVCELCGKLTTPINEHAHSCSSCGDVAGRVKKFLPPTKGSIYYISRDNPAKIKEFIIDLDTEHIEEGIKNVNIAKQNFEDGIIPDMPKGFEGWSKSPCQYCVMKKHACKPDYQAGITKLEESNAIQFAKSVNPRYDYDKTRDATLNFWNKKEDNNGKE